jgi:hypothetical protein
VTATLDLDSVIEAYGQIGVEAVSPELHPCQLHGTHRPEPLVIVKHHIVPLGMAGPDEPGNWLWTCDTGHRNIHTLLGPMCQRSKPTWGVLPPHTGSRSEQRYAREGFERWVAGGCKGNPHAAYALVRQVAA